MSQPQVALGNMIPPMLPAQFTSDVLPGPDGRRLVLIKLAIPGCCVTTVIEPADARRWSEQFEAHVRQAETGIVQHRPGGLIVPQAHVNGG